MFEVLPYCWENCSLKCLLIVTAGKTKMKILLKEKQLQAHILYWYLNQVKFCCLKSRRLSMNVLPCGIHYRWTIEFYTRTLKRASRSSSNRSRQLKSTDCIRSLLQSLCYLNKTSVEEVWTKSFLNTITLSIIMFSAQPSARLEIQFHTAPFCSSGLNTDQSVQSNSCWSRAVKVNSYSHLKDT